MMSAAASAIISRRFPTLQSRGALTHGAPSFACQASDEYSMIMAAAQSAWIDGDKAMTLQARRRRRGVDVFLVAETPLKA